MRVESCYVHPVKGMTPAVVDVLQLEPGRSPQGDRGFVFAFADAQQHGNDGLAEGWVQKHDVISMLSVPGLGAIVAAYDAATRVLALEHNGRQQAASVDHEAERVALAEWLANVVKTMPKNPLSGRTEREPLQLLGAGNSLFTDRGPTQVSLGSLASLAALSGAAEATVDMRRFRFNIVIDGSEPWEEFGWVGKRLWIGETLLEVTAPLRRCKAVNANPNGGGRDLNLLDVLDREFGHLDFGVEANVIEGGSIHPGDAITVPEG